MKRIKRPPIFSFVLIKMVRGTNGRRRRGQKGGVLPALLPLLVMGAKAVGLGALSGGASYGAKKALEAASRIRKR